MLRRLIISVLLSLALASVAFAFHSYGRYGMLLAKRNHRRTTGPFWFAQDDRLLGARWSNGWISVFYANSAIADAPAANPQSTDTYLWSTEFYDQFFPDGDVVKSAVANGSSEIPIPILAIAGLFALVAFAVYRGTRARHQSNPTTVASPADKQPSTL